MNRVIISDDVVMVRSAARWWLGCGRLLVIIRNIGMAFGGFMMMRKVIRVLLNSCRFMIWLVCWVLVLVVD